MSSQWFCNDLSFVFLRLNIRVSFHYQGFPSVVGLFKELKVLVYIIQHAERCSDYANFTCVLYVTDRIEWLDGLDLVPGPLVDNQCFKGTFSRQFVVEE